MASRSQAGTKYATLLNTTKPGDSVTLLIDNKGTPSTAYPDTGCMARSRSSDRTNGFMGVTYYDAPVVKEQFEIL